MYKQVCGREKTCVCECVCVCVCVRACVRVCARMRKRSFAVYRDYDKEHTSHGPQETLFEELQVSELLPGTRWETRTL